MSLPNISDISSAIVNYSQLKPEIRLAQAVSQFEKDLTREQKAALHGSKAQLQASPPDQSDVMRVISEFDKTSSVVVGRRCFGPRFTNFLQAVQQFAALGDLVVGGSQNILACGVWALVRMTLLSIATYSSYLDKLSSLFMIIGRSAPNHRALAQLYPQSKRLQASLTEYFIVVVSFCHHIWKFITKSALHKFISTLNDSDLKGFQSGLEGCTNVIQEEVDLLLAQKMNEGTREIIGLKAFLTKGPWALTHQRRLQKKLRVLGLCSVYDFQTTWKQIRKLGTSSLLSRCNEYQHWRSQENSSTLVYIGKLGSGKSVLLANVVNDLFSWVQESSTPITYFFCRHDIPESLKARTILGSLTQQLLRSVKDFELSEALLDESTDHLDIEGLENLLRHTFPTNQIAYFILDGLDECDVTTVEAVTEQLQKLQEFISLKVCISHRSDSANKQASIWKGLAVTQTVSMSDDNPDIEAYIKAELQNRFVSGQLNIGDPEIILEIAEKLMSGSQGMFLWVALQFESLCAMQTDDAIRKALDNLPKDLPETFSRILQRCKGQGPENQRGMNYQRRILEIVIAAFRPLTAGELREALSVVPGDTDWKASNLINDVASALASCGSLIIVDEEEQTIRLVHHSFKQFLLSESKYQGNEEFTIGLAHKTITNTILTYLSYGVFDTQLSTNVIPRMEIGSAPPQIIWSIVDSDIKKNIALRLLKSWKKFDVDISNTLANAGRSHAGAVDNFPFLVYAKSYCVSHLVCTSKKDPALTNLFVSLLGKDMAEMDTTTQSDRTALTWAAENGEEAVVKLLLEVSKADVETQNADGWTALIRAAATDHAAVVQILLEVGKANVEAKDKDGSTALIWAIVNQRMAATKMLLEVGKANVEAKDRDGWTALIWAAYHGHGAMVKMLLEVGKANVEATDVDGWTALIWAARTGHTAVIEVLLGVGKANVEAKDNDGWTALFWAAESGEEAVTKVLLEVGKANVEAEYGNDGTPLIRAARNGFTAIVELLLIVGKADVEAKDGEGKTALIEAAANGHDSTVRVLLGVGKANIEAQDEDNLTARDWAVANDHKSTIKELDFVGAGVVFMG